MAEEAKWYVAHTYSGYENTVKLTIAKAAKNRSMEDLILDVNIPMETVTEITETGSKTVERKIFPGYVLVKMIMTDETWHLVRNVRGVTGFVGEGNKAIPLTEQEILAMGVEKQDNPESQESEVRKIMSVNYSVGDIVRITSGPFENQTGTVEEIDMEQQKLRIIASIFGRDTPVELDLDNVEVFS